MKTLTEHILKDKLDRGMRLRLYKEVLRRLKMGHCGHGGLCTLLRGAMRNNMFTSLDVSKATRRDLIERYFPELCKGVPIKTIRNDSFWWTPGNYSVRIEHVEKVISLMEKNK